MGKALGQADGRWLGMLGHGLGMLGHGQVSSATTLDDDQECAGDLATGKGNGWLLGHGLGSSQKSWASGQ